MSEFVLNGAKDVGVADRSPQCWIGRKLLCPHFQKEGYWDCVQTNVESLILWKVLQVEQDVMNCWVSVH